MGRKGSFSGVSIGVGGVGAPSMLMSGLLLFVWFSSSVCSTLVNKRLMDSFPYAVTLSAVHMASSALVDLGIAWWRGLHVGLFRRDVLRACLPIALTIDFGKTLTYVSYGLVPASLTHTAKASSPVFSVLVSKLMFNQMPSAVTLLSLVPITIGVTLSALTEINWVFLGFLAAVTASLANVLNSTYTKRALVAAAAPDPLILHMYTAAAAMVMLLPWALLVEMPSISGVATKQAAVEAALAAREFRVLHGGQTPLPYPAAPAHSSADSLHPHGLILPFIHIFPFRAMLLSLLLHYAQNISNIYYLRGVSVLTHQVAQALKRLLNIAGAVLYFGNHVTWLNVAGMGLALLGFTMYSMAKEKTTPHAATASSGSAVNTPGGRRPSMIGLLSPPNSQNGQQHARGGSNNVNGSLLTSRTSSPRSSSLGSGSFGNDSTGSGGGGGSKSSSSSFGVVSPTTLLIEGANGHSSLVPLNRDGSNNSLGASNGNGGASGGERSIYDASSASGGGGSAQDSPVGISNLSFSSSPPPNMQLGGWAALPRTDSTNSFGASASPEPASFLHATAHAHMMAAQHGGGSGSGTLPPSSSPVQRAVFGKASQAFSPPGKAAPQSVNGGSNHNSSRERDLDN